MRMPQITPRTIFLNCDCISVFDIICDYMTSFRASHAFCRMLQERADTATNSTAAPRPQRASLPLPPSSSSSALSSMSSSFMRPGQTNLPIVATSRDHAPAPALAHPAPSPSPSPPPPLPTSAASASTASRDHLFFSLVPHADMPSTSFNQSNDYRPRDRDRSRGGGGGGCGEGTDRPSEHGAKRRRTTSGRSNADGNGDENERWQALQIVGRACQIFRDDDAVRGRLEQSGLRALDMIFGVTLTVAPRSDDS